MQSNNYKNEKTEIITDLEKRYTKENPKLNVLE